MSNDLTIDEVERIAALARLALTAGEKALYAAQLARILDYAGQVAELETRDVAPTSALGGHSPLERPDVAQQGLPREAALSNAPDAAAGFFRVPKVLGDA
jgi:aspartyl-tRNA(Asn)/glutamyl-tRNA(Gln) amidotransferase subunit C